MCIKEAVLQVTPKELEGALRSIVDPLIPYAAVLAGVGILSMALLESGKKLFRVGERFYFGRFVKWIKLGTPVNPTQQAAIYSQLIQSATGVAGAQITNKPPLIWFVPASEECALFTMSLSALSDELRSVGTNVLYYPESDEDLYRFLTRGAKDEDIQKWYDDATVRSLPVRERTEIQDRLNGHIANRIRIFLLRTGNQWTMWNQCCSFVLGFALLGVALLVGATPSLSGPGAFIIAALGGFLAPVAKDLLVAMQQMRSSGTKL